MMWAWDANTKSLRDTQKALTVCLYAWSFFAVSLGIATCVHIVETLF